tara:strand:+ start:4266 stop:4712 length:447 start_codon:yes stop_codon:yes gene_type:complete
MIGRAGNQTYGAWGFPGGMTRYNPPETTTLDQVSWYTGYQYTPPKKPAQRTVTKVDKAYVPSLPMLAPNMPAFGPAVIGTAEDATIWPPYGTNPTDVYIGPIGPTAQTTYTQEVQAGADWRTIGGVAVAVLVLGGGAVALLGKKRRRR